MTITNRCLSTIKYLDSIWGLENCVTKQYGQFKKNGQPKKAALEWPPFSCDLSVLDCGIWSWLKRTAIMKTKNGFYGSELEAIKCLKEAWDELPISMINNCFDNFERRLEKVLETEGEYTE